MDQIIVIDEMDVDIVKTGENYIVTNLAPVKIIMTRGAIAMISDIVSIAESAKGLAIAEEKTCNCDPETEACSYCAK